MKPITKILNDKDKVLFEKALKAYIFSRQRGVSSLEPDLKERFSYSGTIAYSLIITFIKTGSFKIEYMDFLNEELKKLNTVNNSFFEPLQVLPNEIDEISLSNNFSLIFFDEDEQSKVMLSYDSNSPTVVLKPL